MPRNFSILFSALAAFILSIAGIFLIYSATHRAFGYSLALRQLIWILIGVAGAVAINYLSRRQLYDNAPWLYMVGIVLLVLTLFFGVTVKGETSWLEFRLFRVQPSEIMKLFFTLLLAVVATVYSRGKLNRIKTIALMGGILIFPSFIILSKGDLGMTLMYICFFFGWLFIIGCHKEALFLISGSGGFVAGLLGLIIFPEYFGEIVEFLTTLTNPWVLSFWTVAAFLFFYFGVLVYWWNRKITPVAIVIFILVGLVFGGTVFNYLRPHQRQRLEAFVDPGSSPRGSGYHVIQARIAVGSGGLLGQGYMRGTQSQLGFIPELWTDFTYTIVIEEFGLIAGVLILILYVIIVYGTLSTAVLSESWFDFYICAGIALHWMLHIAVNLGFSLELLPVIGLPLPFISYGGSFMVTNWLAMGLVILLSDRPRGLENISFRLREQ